MVAIGDRDAGKESLLVRWATGSPERFTLAWIGDVMKSLTLPEDGSGGGGGKEVELSLWYADLRQLSYSQADVFLLCFSIVDPTSMANVAAQWHPEVMEYYAKLPATTYERLPSFVLCGLKSDLRENEETKAALAAKGLKASTEQDGHALAERLMNCCGYVECSSHADSDAEVERVFVVAAREALRRRKASAAEGVQRRAQGRCCIS